MKQQISYRVLLPIVFILIAAFTLRVDAQTIIKNESSLTWSIGFGNGSYDGLVLQEFGDVSGLVPGRDNFTQLSTAFRLLLATNLLDARLSIGIEYGLQRIREGKVSPYVEYVGGGPVRGPDAMIHSVLIMGDYLVGEISDGIYINAAAGVGVLFFANIATALEYNQNMLPKEIDESAVQLAGSGRLLAPIRVSSSFTIDPELRLLASAGREKAFLVQCLVGLTHRW